ncbi:MAG: 50S ribosomal protein L3 [Candidatus Omnitrophica bacterium]|nr:50S ribosomal protein L3 [Candidatus Omnitrophota bacterium]
MIGLIGKKIGMTSVFNQKQEIIPVTVVEAGPCVVLGVREKKIQLGFEPIKENRVKKPLLGFFKKINLPPLRVIKEFKLAEEKQYEIGQKLTVEIFKEGEFVDITGTSIGKGFQGGMKRWGWSGGPQTHGSMSHRRIGSAGSSTSPGRVLKGHRMPGRMGNKTVTIQNLEVVKVDPENNLLLIKGALPGCKNSYVIVKKAKKKPKLKSS